METTAIDFQRWHNAAYCRKSVRQFTGAPDEAQLQRLRLLSGALKGDGVRIVIFETTPALFSGLPSLTIKNVQYAAAVITREDTPLTRAGFKGQALVLESTAMGLGTCWLGGSFKRKEAARLCGLEKDEQLQALIIIGKPSEPPALVPELARKRKGLDRIVITAKGTSLADAEPWQNAALKCARVAPSAMNMQPWRFAFAPGHLCMVSSGLFSASTQLDLGVAMLHVELGAATMGVRGLWTQDIPENGDEKKGRKKPKDPSETIWVFVQLPDAEGRSSPDKAAQTDSDADE